jgi:hypothetical protein
MREILKNGQERVHINARIPAPIYDAAISAGISNVSEFIAERMQEYVREKRRA